MAWRIGQGKPVEEMEDSRVKSKYDTWRSLALENMGKSDMESGTTSLVAALLARKYKGESEQRREEYLKAFSDAPYEQQIQMMQSPWFDDTAKGIMDAKARLLRHQRDKRASELAELANLREEGKVHDRLGMDLWRMQEDISDRKRDDERFGLEGNKDTREQQQHQMGVEQYVMDLENIVKGQEMAGIAGDALQKYDETGNSDYLLDAMSDPRFGLVDDDLQRTLREKYMMHAEQETRKGNMPEEVQEAMLSSRPHMESAARGINNILKMMDDGRVSSSVGGLQGRKWMQSIGAVVSDDIADYRGNVQMIENAVAPISYEWLAGRGQVTQIEGQWMIQAASLVAALDEMSDDKAKQEMERIPSHLVNLWTNALKDKGYLDKTGSYDDLPSYFKTPGLDELNRRAKEQRWLSDDAAEGTFGSFVKELESIDDQQTK